MNKNGDFNELVSQRYFVYPDENFRSQMFYILPNYAETQEFTIELVVKEDNERYFFQEVKSLLPTKLSYQREGNDFKLIGNN